MVSNCSGGGALLYVPLGLIKSQCALDNSWLVGYMVVYAILALVAIGPFIEIDWKALGDQKRFPYNFNKAKIMVGLVEALLVRYSPSGVKAREDGQLSVKPRY